MTRPDRVTRFFPLAALALGAGLAQAQAPTTGEAALRALVDAPSIATDAVTLLHAEGDRLYVGPRLVTLEDGRFRFVDDRAVTPAEDTEVFSLDAEGGVVWAGLGRAGANDDATAAGFAYTTDAEVEDPDWTRVGSALDVPGDTLQRYGQFLIPAFPVTAPENAAPFGVDYHAPTGVVWSANFFAGLRSLAPREDGSYDAADWRREVLPPDYAERIDPTDETLSFDGGLGPPQPGGINGQANHVAYSVLAQEGGSVVSNTVWVGTTNGINWSSDQDVFVFEIRDESGEVVETFTERAWSHRAFDGSAEGLPGNFVLAIAENDAVPTTGQTPPDVWIATFVADSQTEERPGVVVTRDGGRTFETRLFGESVFDFAFSTDGTVYAAGGGGLFTSRDGGDTWTTTSDFLAADTAQPGLRPGGYLPVVRGLTGFAVAITREDGTGDETLYLGTGQGLLASEDGGARWALFRADPGFDPDAPEASPDRPCAPCARPNPFSPRANGEVLIDFPYAGSGSAQVRIYDVAGVLVRHIDEPRPRPSSALLGTASVGWDGRDADGVRVANGPYVYAVQADGETYTGKILVLQ